MSTEKFYTPKEIRTADMLPLRDSDIDFSHEKSLTKQSDAEAADINNIMAPYARANLLDLVNQHPGLYADLPDAKSYHESMNIIVEAQTAFDQLPAEMRKRFGNDPADFLDFVSREENRAEMVKMGLLERPLADSAPPLAEGAAKRPQKAGEAAPEVPAKQENGPAPE